MFWDRTTTAPPGRGGSDGSGALSDVLGDERLGYPDASARQLHRLANEARPVEGSALPPRHLDADRHPTALVDRALIVSGGPPPDAIPSIDEPTFSSVADVGWLDDEEAVLALEVGQAARAYPVQIMLWHEIVNDHVDGVPIAVTYCPICNSAVAFDRRSGGDVLDFVTSGSLFVGLRGGDDQVAVAADHLEANEVVGITIDGRSATVWHRPGLAFPVGAATVAGGADVGSTPAFYTDRFDASVSFSRVDDGYVDSETGTTWTVFGRAIDGPLEGERLEPVPVVNTRWFAWSGYHPETRLLDGG